MKKWIAAFAFLATTAFAQDENIFAPANEIPAEEEIVFVPNGVITDITATRANGGINPSFAGVTLEGTIKAGGNACEAQRFTVDIKQTKVKGQIVFIPVVKAKTGNSNTMCLALYDADFKGLSFKRTFIVASRLLANATIKKVGSEDNTITLASLLNPGQEEVETPAEEPFAPCGEVGFCTMEMDPKVCRVEVDGETFTARGSNGCQATSALRKALCQAGKSYDSAKVSCVRDGAVEF